MKIVRTVKENKEENKAPAVEIVSARLPLLEELLGEGRTVQARSLATEILKENVSNPGLVYEIMGRSYLVERNCWKALPYLKKAVKKPGSRAETYFHLAYAQQNVQQGYETPPFLTSKWSFHPRRKPVRSILSLVGAICALPFAIGELPLAIQNKYLLHRERGQAEKSLEQAIYLEPRAPLRKEYFTYLLQQVVAENPRQVIQHGEEALKHYPEEALFYALVSQAYAEMGVQSDAKALMFKAVELKFEDGDFLRKYFFSRLNEEDHEGWPLLAKLLRERKGVNWRNASILDLVADYIRQRETYPRAEENYPLELHLEYMSENSSWAESSSPQRSLKESLRYRERFPNCTYPSHPLFLPVLQAKVKIDPDDDDSRYELAVGLALAAELDEQGKPKNVQALQEALEQFRHLHQAGYVLKKGHYPELTYRLLKHYGKEIKEGGSKGSVPKPKLYLVN